jgi:predicted GNAT family acetyltransferase
VTIVDNPAAGRFEEWVGDELAELQYRVHGDRLVLVHTGVPPALGGRGLGAALVRAAVERARREGLTLVPVCPFAREWLERHPAEIEGVAVDWRVGRSA